MRLRADLARRCVVIGFLLGFIIGLAISAVAWFARDDSIERENAHFRAIAATRLGSTEFMGLTEAARRAVKAEDWS